MFWGAARHKAQPEPAEAAGESLPSSGRLYAILFFTGLLGIGYEVLVVRVLSQVLEDTIFSFASILSVYLLGTAGGAALYQRLSSRLKYEPTLTYLLQLLSTACLVGVMFLWRAEAIYDAVRTWLGSGFFGSIAGELVLSAVIFLLPTMLMGGAFSHIGPRGAAPARRFWPRPGGQSRGWGFCAPRIRGAAASPCGRQAVFNPGVPGLPASLSPSGNKKAFPASVPLLLATAILLGFGPMHLVTVPQGAKVAAYAEGVMAAVSVIEGADGEFSLKVNNHFVMGGTASFYSDRRQGHIPPLAASPPEAGSL